MKVLVKSQFSRDITDNLDVIVARQMDGNDYDVGQIEAIRATSNNIAEAFGRLIQVLVQRQRINLEDVPGILAMYETTIELSSE